MKITKCLIVFFAICCAAIAPIKAEFTGNLSLQGTEKSNFDFITYNVNYSRRATGEYELYSWENRRESVYKLIQNSNSTIIFLQEILTQNKEEVQTNLSDYEWFFEPTNSRNGVCCNGIGIKKNFLPDLERQKFSYNFDQFDKTAETVLGLVIGDLCLLNVHYPMEEKGRMTMAANMNQCLPSDKTYRILIAGDFNSFPDGRGAEQLEIIQNTTETVRISDLAISESSGEIATRSFKAYPYDSVPEEALKMHGKLDHIFVKGLVLADQTTPIVLDARTVEGTDISPSDHYPIVASLVFE